MADPPEETDQVESAQANNRIDNTGNPCKIAEQKGDKIEAEYTDQQPVDSSDND